MGCGGGGGGGDDDDDDDDDACVFGGWGWGEVRRQQMMNGCGDGGYNSMGDGWWTMVGGITCSRRAQTGRRQAK